jgi:putative oxidoreductase
MKHRVIALQPYALSLLRLVAGFTFAAHGLQKIFGMFGGKGVAIASLPGLAGMLELCGGVLIAAGLFTRPVAFVLCGEMAFAYFMQHGPRGFWPIRNGGELAVLYCFIFLFLWAAGPGPLSLDRLIRRKS